MKNKYLISCVLFSLFFSVNAEAALPSAGILDQVITEFSSRAASWQTVIINAASRGSKPKPQKFLSP